MFYDDDDLDDIECQCPDCQSPQTLREANLGQLGSILHYRCRYCGAVWGRIAPVPEAQS